jgi:predicted nucleotide-binding protein
MMYSGSRTEIAVTALDRETVEQVLRIFDEAAPEHVEPEPVPEREPPVVFIGHGRDQQWRDLKDHLQDQHGYDVEAYEVGARAGHGIRDILDAMLRRSSFAILVMTGEDEDAEGHLHARDNVIHEVGLFQGHVGWPRAVVLLESGTEEFSNIHGIQQIRFERGNIRSTYGDVLATLKREFGSDL